MYEEVIHSYTLLLIVCEKSPPHPGLVKVGPVSGWVESSQPE